MALIQRPPPLLKIEQPAPGKPVAAHFQPEGRLLEFQPLEGNLPQLVTSDGLRAMSELHHHLRTGSTELRAAMNHYLAQAFKQIEASPDGYLRVYSPHPLVMSLPWEASGFLGPSNGFLCRRSQPEWPPFRWIRWLQSCLNRGSRLTLDGKLGPSTLAALTAFWGNRPLPPTQSKIIQELAAERREINGLPRLVLLQEETGSIATRLQFENDKREILHTDPSAPASAALFSASEFGAVYVIGSILEGSDSGETVISTAHEQLTANSLARLFDRGPSLGKPVVFLDVTLRPGSDKGAYERHLLRRNLFAHNLYSSGQVLAVVATATPGGTPSPALHKRAAELGSLLARGGTLRQVVVLLQKTEGVLAPFGGPTTALWAAHPDLPALAN